MSKQEALDDIYFNCLQCMGFVDSCGNGTICPNKYPDILQIKQLILAEEVSIFKIIRKLHRGKLTVFNYKLIKDMLIGCWRYYVEHYHKHRWAVIDYYSG